MNGPLIMLVGGGAAVAYLVYDWMQYKMRLRLRREEAGSKRRMSLDTKVYMVIAYTVVLAFLFARGIDRPVADTDAVIAKRCLIVAAYVLVAGFGTAFYQARKEGISKRVVINQEVVELVNSFRSVFRVRPTVFSALDEANKKVEPPVGTAVAHAVTSFYVTANPKRAFEELRRRIDNPYLEQFVYILERGEDAKHDDIVSALNGLLDRLRRARELRDQSEVNLTVISGQTRIIQIIAVTLVFIVAAAPILRQAYESPAGQILFVIIASVGIGTSMIIDRRANSLKERVL